MKKKLLSLALSMALLISLVSVGGFSIAAEPVDFGSKAWENFENMTEEQADSFFEGVSNSNYDLQSYEAGVKEGAGEDGSKGFSMEMQFYDWGGWVNTKTDVLDLEGVVGIRLWYKVESTSQDVSPTMRLVLRDYWAGAWTDIGFAGGVEGRETVAPGTYAQTILFSDFPSYNPNGAYQLGLEVGDVKNETITLTIDNITFLTSSAYEDFENMTEEQADSFFEGVSNSNYDLQSYEAGVKEGAGEDGSKGFSMEMQFYDWGGWVNTKTDVLDLEGVVGIRLWYKVESTSQDVSPTMRLVLRDYWAGAWTDIGFAGGVEGRETVAPGTYAQTILFSDFSSYNPSGAYQLGIEVGDVKNETITLTLDNIEFIYYGDVGAGDRTDLNAALEQYKTIYEGNNQDASGDKLYSDTSYAAFKEAYEAARDLAADATQTAIDSALRRLQGTYEALEQLKLDYSALTKAITDADTFFASSPEETYTEHSIGLIQGVYNTAKAMRDDQTATTQKQIDNMAVSLNTAVSSACPIPDLDAEYPALEEDRLVEDFEEYESLDDLPTSGGGDGAGGWQFDSNFRTQLDKTTPISGEKSLKISWTNLGEDVWGAYRLWMYHTGIYPMGNQAMTFTIKVDFDYTMTVTFYDAQTSTQYKYVKEIKASDEPQTITLPFNKFVNDTASSYQYGCNIPADQWEAYVNQWLCFKIQIDRSSGLPESGEMWLDCFKLTSNDGPQEPAPAPVLPEDPDNPGGDGPDEPDDPGVIVPGEDQPDDSDGFHVQQDFEEMTDEALAEDFTSDPEGALTLDTDGALFGSNSLKMTYNLAGADSAASFQTAFPGLRGDGLYMRVLSANDVMMKVRLDDGSLWVEYDIAVAGSDEAQLVFTNWVDIADGRGTFDELNKAAVTMSVTLSSEEAVSGEIFFDDIGYYVYDEMLDATEEEPPVVNPDGPENPDGPDGPGKPGGPDTGEAAGLAAMAAMGLAAAAVAVTAHRRRKSGQDNQEGNNA